jgi:hypothetical protein
MGDLKLNGATSGTITVTPTAVAGTNTITLPASTGTVALTASPTFSGTVTATTVTSPAATALTIQSAGTTAMTVSTGQNVGIGTTTPAFKLDVPATVQFQGITIGTNGTDIKSTAYGPLTLHAQASGAGANSFVALYTSGAEAARIDSSGNLLVGTTSAGGKIYSYQNAATTNIGIDCGSGMGVNAALWTRVASTSTVLAYYLYNSTNVGSITTNGTSVAYNTTSDYRLKENVAPMTTGLAIVKALKPVTYDWISDKSAGEGFVAHELQAVIPHAVTGDKDAVNEDGSIKPQGVDYSKIVVHLVAAMQEQQAQIEDLKGRLAALEAGSRLVNIRKT